jgi:anti-anti-sigma regulatory factor
MATAPIKKPAAAPAKVAPSASGTFSAEVISPDSTTLPPIYEAAVLYSADYYDAAETVLKDYLRTGDGKNSLRAWLMMFDLYQMTNNRKEFDALAIMFSVKFERSSPNWLEAADNVDPRRKEKRERKDFFAVTPAIDGAILGEIDRLEAFAKQMGSARVDFAKVKQILAEEAELFSIVLQRIRRAKIPLWFNALEVFAADLKTGINTKAGRPLSESQGYWSLLFELYVLDGRLQEYEDLGLEYAVAFEMSPPAWENVNRPTGSADDTPSATQPHVAVALLDSFPLKGVISAASRDVIQQLTVFASSRHEVAIDMSGLMRIDFSAMGVFFDTIRAIHLSQKRVVLSNLNELVAALLEVFGLTKHAILMRKKSV